MGSPTGEKSILLEGEAEREVLAKRGKVGMSDSGPASSGTGVARGDSKSQTRPLGRAAMGGGVQGVADGTESSTKPSASASTLTTSRSFEAARRAAWTESEIARRSSLQ